MMRLGVISDTHGLLRPEAVDAIVRVDHILHAGDVGSWAIIETLRKLATVTAIRGNIDHAGPCSLLPATEMIELGGCACYMLHDGKLLDLDPVAAGIGIVISGHSHQPSIERRKGVLYLNPGSAGPRRFSLPVSLAVVTFEDRLPKAEIIRLLDTAL